MGQVGKANATAVAALAKASKARLTTCLLGFGLVMPPGPVSPAVPFVSNVTALLGPTNTGKTHQATVRMLEHRTGMLGLPLRLLAREVYDRVVATVGKDQVALVTGEERQIPAHPRFWICTVEAMPRIEVEFLAVDEIQLAGHHERGHIFTERLLGWRGTLETWFLGAETIKPLIERLVPTARVERKPRLSVLHGVGSTLLGQLPPRTAVVAFSADRVYELAERIKLKRGGAAVVLGALSPRTRNAQIAMYQAGEVDFLVATDAIGMGLNMNVDCVAFADLKKYDGRQSRLLEDAELAQIAGRAGRNRNDGKFCTLAPLPGLPFATQKAIEEHRFAPVTRVYWRNEKLSFDSTDALVQSLSIRPFSEALILADHAEDQQALARLTRRGDVQSLAVGPDRVRLLWQVCQIPDFRKLLLDDHFDLLASVFLQLCQRGTLAADWVRQQVDRLDDAGGELDTLLVRMAAIRTWTFITHRTDWLHDAQAWQERTLAIEDHLSDALHDQLVSRFVDQKGRHTGGRGATVKANGRRPHPAVTLGARLKADQKANSLAALASLVTPVSAAAQERSDVQIWMDAPDARFVLRSDGRIYDTDDPNASALAKLTRGPELLRPELVVLPSMPAALHLGLRSRLSAFVRDTVNQHLGELETQSVSPGSRAWRAIMYGLRKGLGTVALAGLDEFVFEDLSRAEHESLRALGFRRRDGVGYLRSLARPAVLDVRWSLLVPHLDLPSHGPAPKTIDENAAAAHDLMLAAGYIKGRSRWVRLDTVDVRTGSA